MIMNSLHVLAVSFLPIQNFSDIPILEKETPAGNQIVYFIRHGESTSNVPDPETGILLTSGKSLAVALTKRGEDQAVCLGMELAKKIARNEKIMIFSSTALRARQTALAIFNVLKDEGFSCKLETDGDEDLCELGQGAWEGKPKDALYRQELSQWEQLSPFDKFAASKVASGESYQTVAARMLKATQKIIDKYPTPIILIISHHAAMNAFALSLNKSREELSKSSQDKLFSVPLHNCDIISFEIPSSRAVLDAKAVTH